MKKINVSKITPGMVLDCDVLNRDGRFLFPRGTRLTSKEIRTLKMWGIPEIFVQTRLEKQDPENQLLQKDAKSPLDNVQAKKFLDRWFANNDMNLPVIETLYDICLSRFDPKQFEKALLFENQTVTAPSEKDVIKPVKDIQQILSDDIKLPALPTIFSEINGAIKNPKCSGKDIAEIVSKDPGLSATLLKIVNSAYYGLGERVESLDYAAMALGTRQVSSLALGITVINYFKGISDQGINMESFWRHSIGCAIAGKTFATHVTDTVPERVFIGGLLHDIGRLVFLNIYPDEFNFLLKKSISMGVFLNKLEPKFFGMSHAQFGSLMAKAWNFSDRISQMIRLHHKNFKTIPEKEVAVVHVSNWLVNAIGIGSSVERGLPRLNMHAWDALDISESLLEPVIKQIDRQIVEVVKFFYE